MILLTTSRRPTKRIRKFCHDVERSIPDVIRINRGKLNLDGIAEKALELNADRVIIIFATKILLFNDVFKVPRGKPDKIIPINESALSRSINLRSPDKEIFEPLLQ